MLLMFIAAMLGVCGIAVFGFLGLQTAGPGRELDQIYAIVGRALPLHRAAAEAEPTAAGERCRFRRSQDAISGAV